jgi:hypothetical protein
LTNFTDENIKGFKSFAPLSAYAEMIKKPQCARRPAVCAAKRPPPHAASRYSIDTWEFHWITTFEATVFQVGLATQCSSRRVFG